MPPIKSDWQRIYLCEGTPDPRANAVLYAGSDINLWVRLLGEYLAEGKTVAVMGENAEEVVRRYQQTG